MSNPSHFRRKLALAALACAIAFSAHAQEENSGPKPSPLLANPEFIPPPPPNFTPPPPPTTIPTRRVAPRTTPQVQQTAPAVAQTPTEDILLQRQSQLIEQEDPRMKEVVGLIRIPEMGTNEVLEMLENFTSKPILRQQTLPAVKITFFSQEALTRGEAITAIESLLALNGIAITNVGTAFLKAIPSSIINAQVPRVWEGSTLGAVPSQTIYEKIFELDFLTPEEASAILQPLMSQGSPISFAKSNFILITDALINLQRIERLLPVLDKPAELKTKMLFFELQNIEAQDVVRRLQTIIAGPLKRQLENNTSVEADERTNQLLVFTHPSNEELVTSLIERLDISVAPTTGTKVYSIRYAEATEVVSIIDQIVSGQREVRMETGSGNDAAAQAARDRAVQLRQLNQAAANVRADASNLQFSSFLTIVPDERANTIVANGTQSDLQYLEQLIGEIDTLLAQVRIEVVIAEVTLSNDDTRGIDSLGFTYSGTGFDVDLNDPTSESRFTPGEFYGVTFGDGISWGPNEAFSFSVLLNAIAQKSNAKVLSAPTIVTTHNKEATVSVGREQPVITGTTTSDLSSGLSTRNQVQYRDIKLELKVTPLIGSDGVVQLEIEQQNQAIIELVSVDPNSPPQPVVGTRAANSYVSVKDGGLIALGGLQELTNRDTKTRMAILGKLPVVGDLFSRTQTESERTELLIFIRPTIIRDAEEADKDANKLIDAIEGNTEVRDYLDEGTFRVPEKDTSDEREVPRRNKP